MVSGRILAIYNSIINYIFPPSCLNCTNYTTGDNGFCHECFAKLNFITKPYCEICGKVLTVQIFDNVTCGTCIKEAPPYKMGRSLLKFDEHSKKIIHAFKYFDKTSAANVFARLIINRYGKELQDIELIIPVPMNRFKRLFRMYNHSQILAKEIAKILDKTHTPDLLIKTKWTKSQTALSKRQREQNLANSIKFNKKYDVRDKKLLLIDDVKTTGTTIKKCSSLLKSAGAKEVYVITIASTASGN